MSKAAESDTAGRVPLLLLGATGYVAGEALRLLALHPRLQVVAALARSRLGEPIGEVFGHLRGCHEGLAIGALDELPRWTEEGEGTLAVLSALPHRAAASLLDELLTRAAAARRHVVLVDHSADFRLPAAEFRTAFGSDHPAPARLGEFTCALPELYREAPPQPWIAHPGCFTTATTLGCAALAACDLAEPCYRVVAITGSSGSGREPIAATHHPERHGSLRAYNVLAHRHEPEMRMLLGRLRGGEAPEVLFVPHSGPFVRGIHATIHARLHRDSSTAELTAELRAFHAGQPFVEVGDSPPSLKDVVGSNRCRLSASCRGRDAVILSVIDNLTKGAAGGGIQWLNRLLGWDETLGLRVPALGWG